MVDATVLAVLEYLHVIAAMGWLGGLALVASSITPGTRSMNPAANLEFLIKVGPRMSRFFVGSATATLIFGLGLFFSRPGLGNYIYAGILFGLIAYSIGLAVVFPSIKKAVRLAKEFIASGQSGPPPGEIPSTMKRGGMASVIALLLLLVAVMFMVASGFFA